MTCVFDSAKACAVEVAITENFGWRQYQYGTLSLWFKGWLAGLDGEGLAERLSALPKDFDQGALGDTILDLDGHFSFVASCPEWTIAAVDWVRSIPLAAAKIGEQWYVDAQPNRLRIRAGLGESDFDCDAVHSVAMSGFTIVSSP